MLFLVSQPLFVVTESFWTQEAGEGPLQAVLPLMGTSAAATSERLGAESAGV